MPENKIALITGASSGIGKEFAKLCVEEGIDVILVAKDEQKLKKVATELENTAKNSITLIVKDLSLPSSGKEIYDKLKASHIRIDILINDAGFGTHGKFPDIPLDEDINQITVNIISLTTLTKLISKDMVSRGNGKILNIASKAAFLPGPFMTVYYATKAYVLSFSEALSEELNGTGVTVSVLCPGPTNTGFAKRANMENSPLFSQTMEASIVALKGFEGMMQGKRIIVPGLKNNIEVKLMPLVPHRILFQILRKLQPV